MSYQILVADIDVDSDVWLMRTEEHINVFVSKFSEVGTKPNGQQQLRLTRLASRLQTLIPPTDPLWGGREPLADVLALQTKGWLISVEPQHAERLLRAILPLARHLRLAFVDLQTGVYFEASEQNKVIPEAALPTLQALDPELTPRNKALTEAAMYKAFAERFTAPLAELGLSRADPGYSPSCIFSREQSGMHCELIVIYSGRPSNPRAEIKLNISSVRAGRLGLQAEQDLLNKSFEPRPRLVVSLPVSGQVWTQSGEVVGYDKCRSLEELDWLAEVAVQRLPAMVQLSESIAGINALNRELLRIGWKDRSSLFQLTDYAYLIWGNQLAEFEELAARQLARQRETGSTYGFDVEQLIAYCRDTLKPDPDGLP